MAQEQVQPNVSQTQPTIKQPVNQQSTGQTQPMGGQETTSIWKKWWLWLIIVLIVIGAGAGVYFLLLK